MNSRLSRPSSSRISKPKKNLKVFLDANVLFSAAYRKSNGLLKLWRVKSIRLITSRYALEEAKRNLKKPAAKLRLESLTRKIQIKEHLNLNQNLPPSIKIAEKDQPILLSALSAQCDLLLTGDLKDFGPYMGKSFEGMKIMRPAEFFRLFPTHAQNPPRLSRGPRESRAKYRGQG